MKGAIEEFLNMNKINAVLIMAVLTVIGLVAQLLSPPQQALALQSITQESQIQQFGNWQSFSPPTGEFTIFMPGNVRTGKINRNDLAYTAFCAQASGYVYWILVPINTTNNFLRAILLDDFKQKDSKDWLANLVAGAKAGVTESGGKIVFASDMAGSEWTGEIINAAYRNNKKHLRSWLVGMAHTFPIHWSLMLLSIVMRQRNFLIHWLFTPLR